MTYRLILPGQFILTEVGTSANRKIHGKLLTSITYPDGRQYLYGVFGGICCVLERDNSDSIWRVRFDLPKIRSGNFVLRPAPYERLLRIWKTITGFRRTILVYDDLFPLSDNTYPQLEYQDTLIISSHTGIQFAATHILFDGYELFYKLPCDMEITLETNFQSKDTVRIVEQSRVHTVKEMTLA